MEKIKQRKHELGKEKTEKADNKKLELKIDIPRTSADFLDETLQIA